MADNSLHTWKVWEQDYRRVMSGISHYTADSRLSLQSYAIIKERAVLATICMYVYCMWVIKRDWADVLWRSCVAVT